MHTGVYPYKKFGVYAVPLWLRLENNLLQRPSANLQQLSARCMAEQQDKCA
jgi:hypothetical protein